MMPMQITEDEPLVTPDEFERLLISKRRLERADDPIHRVLGLYDPQTGVTVKVVETEFLRHVARGEQLATP